MVFKDHRTMESQHGWVGIAFKVHRTKEQLSGWVGRALKGHRTVESQHGVGDLKGRFQPNQVLFLEEKVIH